MSEESTAAGGGEGASTGTDTGSAASNAGTGTARTTVLGGAGAGTATGAGGGDGAAGSPFAGLSEEHRALAQAKGWKGVDDVLGSYANLERLLGGDKVALPGKDAKPEDWDGLYDKLGRPKDPAGYKIDRPKDLPDGAAYNPALVEAFKPVAHKLGLNGTQAQGLHDWLATESVKMQQTHAAEAAKVNEAGIAKLRAEWGAEYEAKASQAFGAIKQFGGQPLVDWMNQTGLGDNPNFIRLFANIGAAIGESGLATGSGGGGRGIGSPAQAIAEIERLTADKSFVADLDGSNGQAAKRAAQQKWDRLNAIAAGDDQPN